MQQRINIDDQLFLLHEIKYKECFFREIFIIMSSIEKSPSQWQNRDSPEPQIALTPNKPIPFDWDIRWLKGHQYNHILENIDAYCQTFGFKKYQQKTHPKEIYSQPINGLIYFVKGKGVGQDFGFPRMEFIKKKYRWKKMNFTTDLPKKHPYVTYVVASAMRAHLIEQGQHAEFRMHAVIPYCDGHNSSEDNEYILCHVRSVDQKRDIQDSGFRSCFIDKYVDFYRLFAFLHNFSMPE